MRNVVLCADDAGWSAANDHAIARHAAAGEISAVSVLVDGPVAHQWRDFDAPGRSCSLGLHLNMTWEPGSDSAGLGRLLAAAFLRRLSRSDLVERIGRQLQRFDELIGRPPEFVDGHQHVHMLSGLRQALIEALSKRYGATQRPVLRVPYSHSWRGTKALALNLLGARAFGRHLTELDWPRNTDFAGAYDFSDSADYQGHMRQWLAHIRDGGLIMAHPGADPHLEHGRARAAESAYFSSPAWLEDREAAGIRLIPFTSEALKQAL